MRTAIATRCRELLHVPKPLTKLFAARVNGECVAIPREVHAARHRGFDDPLEVHQLGLHHRRVAFAGEDGALERQERPPEVHDGRLQDDSRLVQDEPWDRLAVAQIYQLRPAALGVRVALG